MTGWFGRRRARFALLALVTVALVGVAAASFVLLRGSRGSSGSTAGDRTAAAPDGLQASFLAATGVRTGAPTVVTGAVVNTGSTPRAASFSVDGLPVGSSLATVLPSANAPSADGEWWSCTTTTCTLTGAAGAATIGPSAGAQLLLAFEGVPTTPDVDVAITVDGVGTSSVPLQLAGGVPPLAADALGLSLVGGGTVLTGTPSTTAATVTNFASTSIAPGALTLGLTPPAIPGLSAAPSGAGWSCTATSCTNTAVVAPLAVTSPLLIAQSAPEGTASGEGTLAAVATVGVPAMQASASSSVTVRPPRSWTVGSRVFLDRGSIVGGSTLSATIEIVPTGRGLLTDTVDVGLDVPAGYVPDWTSTTSTGPFQCSSTGCSSTAPLTAGTQYLLTVPVAVPVDARPGTASMSDEVSVSDEEGSTPQRSSSVSFTVVPAPAASLRARLSGGVGTDVRGGAIGFAPGASRELQVVVTNEGGSPYRAGSAVYVTATPSTTEWLTSVGGDGWTCIPGTSGQVSPRWPLRCQQILRADLAPGASLSVPFALAPGEGGVGEWTIGTGTTMRTAAAAPTHARVEVQPHAPRLAVAIDQEQPIHDGGSGEIVVRSTNLGDRAAAGGVLAVMVPDDVELLSWAGPSWSCVDATVSGAGGSLLCSTTVIAEPGGRLPSLFLAVGVDGGTESVRLSAWASAVGQFDVEGIEPVTARFAVASAVDVDAGPEMTVATPVVGADGVAAPAVVTLVGSADLAAARNLQWTQLCLQPGAADCGSTVSPAVAWSGVPAGSVPNTVTARFTAPAGITAPTDLFFRLSGVVGSSSVSDVVVVHLVPASFSLTTSGDPTAIDSSANPIGVPQPGPPSSPSPPTATIAGSGAPMTVLTGAAAQLVGGGTGVGSLGYSWSQTSGPSAAIDGSSATSPILSFTAPVLAPDEDSVSLDFELTVTDSTGATATSSITVEVVWGDDGLQVALSAGAPNVVAPNVVASPGTPVTIAATVTSLGAPYTYDWDVEGIELPSGTDTGSASLSFAAGDSAIDGSAILTVTDRFGRVTTTSIPVIVSALPAGQVPTAFCQAVDALAAARSQLQSTFASSCH